MSAKLEALIAELARSNQKDMVVRAVAKIVEMVGPRHSATPYVINGGTDEEQYVLPPGTTKGHTLELAEEVVRLREIKALVASLSSAVSEYVGEVEQLTHKSMSTNGPTGFKEAGFSFSMTSQNYVPADKSQGGTGNPALKQWLRDHDMPDVAEGTINANTLKSAVNAWLLANPIELTVEEGGENRIVEGQELLDKLDLTQEQFDERVRDHEALLEMVSVTTVPALSVKKV